MTAVLTHELRTPIASITGSIQVLHKGLNLRGSDKKLMDIMLRGKEQLENLVRDFLLLARPGQGERNKIDLRDLADEVVALIRFHPDWNSGIRVEVLSSGEESFIGNRTEMRQALWNVIVNAVQAMPEGERLPWKSRKLMIRVHGRNWRYRLPIREVAWGVSIWGKSWNLFIRQRHGNRSRLAIVNRVIENHGGNFIIENTPWGGPDAECEFREDMQRRVKMPSILVVDDDQGMRDFMEILLMREGYEVNVAPGGREALQLCKKNRYDVVITDLKMPKMSGIDLLKEIKESAPETMVIVLTAFASGESALAAMKEGAYDYIEKNFDVEDLKKRYAMP